MNESMTFNYVLISIAATIALASLVFLIIGLVKKKENMWIIALFSFLAFSIYAARATYYCTHLEIADPEEVILP